MVTHAFQPAGDHARRLSASKLTCRRIPGILFGVRAPSAPARTPCAFHFGTMIRSLPLAASVLAGCLAVPSAGQGEPAAAPPKPAPASSTSAESGPPALSVDEAVLSALRQSPALQIARHERNVGLIGADRNRPGFRPEVNATASQILRSPRVDLPGRPDEVVLPNSSSRVEIDVRQPLYQFGVGGAAGRRATAMANAARMDYRKAELDLVLQVREAVVGLARSQAMAEVARRGRELAKEHVRITREQKERGFQADVDVLEAERQDAEAESGLLQAENGIRLARANVNRVLGRDIDAPLAVAPLGTLPPAPPPLRELLSQAVRQRPEAGALRHNIEAAEEGIKLAKAAGKPRIDLEAAYALQTPTALIPSSGISAGFSITAPLFDGGVRQHTVREAEERVGQLKSARAALEQGIALELETQRFAMDEARARAAVAERGVAAAEKAYEITRLRMELGRAVQVEVLNARLGLQRSLADRASAEFDLRLAEYRLQRALGEGPTLEPAGR